MPKISDIRDLKRAILDKVVDFKGPLIEYLEHLEERIDALEGK